jgi:hypothetical protein
MLLLCFCTCVWIAVAGAVHAGYSLTGTLPCEYSQLQLLLADLSGNHWHTAPIPGELGCEAQTVTSHSLTAPHSVDLQTRRQSQQQQTSFSSSCSNSSSRRQLSQHLNNAASGGVLTAPRCWLRRYCYDEGAFICLQVR